MSHVVGLLLAAGEGRRFGGDKLVRAQVGGRPLVVAAARVFRQAIPRTVLVVPPRAPRLEALLRDVGVSRVINPDPGRGLGSSLAVGVRATADARAWVVGLADMPFLQPATVAAIAQVVAAAPVPVVPLYGDRRGHPVGFPAAYRDRLWSLSGPEGGRALLGPEVWSLSVTDPGVVLDIDTPADLAGRQPDPDLDADQR